MSDDAAERLRDLAGRIERLAIAPAEVSREKPWLRVASPLFRLVGWRPRIRTAALRALLDLLREACDHVPLRERLPDALEAAIEELSDNVAAAERASVVRGPEAYGPLAGWLTRLHEIAARAASSVEAPDDRARRAVAFAGDAEWAFTPLALRSSSFREGGRGGADGSRGDEGSAAGGASRGGDEQVGRGGDADEDPRLVEIELAAVDRVLDAARAETHFLGRRRRLFEAARKLLLDASAALPVDGDAVHARAQHIADEIVLVNRWEAAGVSPEVSLSHQALSAVSRGERQRLYAALRATVAIGSSAGHLGVVARAGEALRKLEGAAIEPSRDQEAERSAGELLGDATVHTVRDAYDAARRELALRKATPAIGEDAAEEQTRRGLWERYLQDHAVIATLSAAVSVDGCFEVGGTLAPVRIEEEMRRVRVVAYPTQDLTLVPTQDATDLQNAVIEDPRSVILALAEGRLLARKFLHVDTVRTSRTRLQSEARIYVLDGSDSMLMGAGGRSAGARARMRDAILLAELATLYRRASVRGRTTRVVLFYRYFTKLLGDVVRVDSQAEALGAMADVVGTPRHGGTDIEAALLASFGQIREARASDPDLARAQIVLVTDGAAAVDEAKVRAAREDAGDFPIGVSVIALGEENTVLRRLVARQRARGEPAFYHFVSDIDLGAVVEGRRAAGASVYGPAAVGATGAIGGEEQAAALRASLGSLVEEIDAIERARGEGARGTPARDAIGTTDADTLAALGVTHHETEGERAHREVRDRDDRALAARFDNWFPPEPAGAAAASSSAREQPPALAGKEGGAVGQSAAVEQGGSMEAAAVEAAAVEAAADLDPVDVEAVAVVLATLADVLADLGGTPAERRADAIEILERLLPDARLSPARYRAVVRARPPAIARAIVAVRA